MSFAMTVLYHQPEDVAVFDDHYTSTHQGIAATIPGLRSYTTCWPTPGPEGHKPDFHLVATLVFDDMESFGSGLASEQGKAALADLENFAQAGTTVLTGELHTVV